MLTFALYLLLLIHPEPLFAYSTTSGNITFYSHTRLAPEIDRLASRIADRLAISELNDPAVHHRVFIVGRSWLWTLLNGPYARAMARNVELGNAILVPNLDVQSELIRHFDGRTAEAAGILTHEAVHTLMQNRIGLLRVWQLAWWQKEGYPEYIASERCRRSESPARYRAAARMWQDLLESRHWTFDEALRLRAPF